jgi:hypothetical protein
MTDSLYIGSCWHGLLRIQIQNLLKHFVFGEHTLTGVSDLVHAVGQLMQPALLKEPTHVLALRA